MSFLDWSIIALLIVVSNAVVLWEVASARSASLAHRYKLEQMIEAVADRVEELEDRISN